MSMYATAVCNLDTGLKCLYIYILLQCVIQILDSKTSTNQNTAYRHSLPVIFKFVWWRNDNSPFFKYKNKCEIRSWRVLMNLHQIIYAPVLCIALANQQESIRLLTDKRGFFSLKRKNAVGISVLDVTDICVVFFKFIWHFVV